MEFSDCTKSLALELFSHYKDHVYVQVLLDHSPYHGLCKRANSSLFTGLHCASFFGIVELVLALIKMGGYDVNKEDHSGATPLLWAARNGHEEVLGALLECQDIKPDKSATIDQTPLWWAEYHTSLWLIAKRQEGGAAKLLSGREGIDYLAPLFGATLEGHEGAEKQLWGPGDVTSKCSNNYGFAPLLWAVENKHVGIVKLLLGREDIRPDRSDSKGRTLLSHAAEKGHEEIVKLLLGREDVNPDSLDEWDETPLSFAVEKEHEGIVKLLLARQDVNPDRLDGFGLTSLSWAAETGREGIVKLLYHPYQLGRTKLATQKKQVQEFGTTCTDTKIDGTKLTVPTGMGGTVLLGRKDANLNGTDRYGRTPLLRATINGHEGVLKLLLGSKDVDLDKPDGEGRTPLWWAVEKGHTEMVELLQARKTTNSGLV